MDVGDPIASAVTLCPFFQLSCCYSCSSPEFQRTWWRYTHNPRFVCGLLVMSPPGQGTYGVVVDLTKRPGTEHTHLMASAGRLWQARFW
jgi:hypothetical protein